MNLKEKKEALVLMKLSASKSDLFLNKTIANKIQALKKLIDEIELTPGPKGDSYTITSEDYQEIADLIELPEVKDGSDYHISEKDYQNIAKLVKVPKPKKPKDGKDYVITEKDLKEVAKLIDTEEIAQKVKVEEKKITAEHIRDKLETLKDDERLDVSAIKGLEEYFKDDQKSFQFAGGNYLSKMIDVDISGLVKDSTGRYVLGNGTQEIVDFPQPIGTPLYLDVDSILRPARAVTGEIAGAIQYNRTHASYSNTVVRNIDYSILLETGQGPVTLANQGEVLYLSEIESGKYTFEKPLTSQQHLRIINLTTAVWIDTPAFGGIEPLDPAQAHINDEIYHINDENYLFNI